ncbi:ribokinase [Mucilaginibacter limnophilus]|uniref:Ribokinase n=1 Tax=Mucilaginibacter limnophilus TaxID=1932778 RepID=A0A437MQT5_9SPHI|nr:PfkB family carbohydrate kinase [Mucilaginibacter limnophilus]RVT99991.1 ribokinase [Mucilaginibacter limnophilus]
MNESVFDICCIGHITQDKVINPQSTVYMPGGTAFYFSQAMQHLPVNYGLVTSVAQTEMVYVEQLQGIGIKVQALPGSGTVYFENSYAEDSNNRTQRVLQKADTFDAEQLKSINAKVFHLGPLLADDFAPDLIEALASQGKISLDVQGLLRRVEDTQVLATDWQHKRELLPFVHTLKVNEHELAVLTGQEDIQVGAVLLAGMGVKEVVVTLGSEGSLIYADGEFHTIPVFKPDVFRDATGCGDTYMAGYLYKRVKGVPVTEAGLFASAMAGLKSGISGPFTGTEDEVNSFIMRN